MNDLSVINTSGETSCDWIPRINMEFDTVLDAWNFWKTYGGRMGFNVRKQYENKDKNGVVTSRRFVCSKEGFRKANKQEHLVTNPRAETRTGCLARMGFSLDKVKGKYVVQDFVSEHNHIMHLPGTTHLMSTQRAISDAQAAEIELADAAGVRLREAHELNASHAGGSSSLGYTYRDHKNYLRTKRQKSLMYGEAGCLLRYFHSQTVENPSFQYSIQLDNEEQITNIFWADAKMLIDYATFGDVVALDTTFGTNKENRPLAVFVGFNHFRELVVFGVALLYDETVESFNWLFETFLATHDKKHPKTIFTDQDIAMGKAIANVLPDTWHGLCTWHIMQNATKRLLHDGSNVLGDFKACMYNYDKEADFEEAFTALRGKVKKSSWLDSIYALKKKWAKCYMTNVFSLGMRSTQLSESFNKDLKDYLQYNMDITRFFHHFERVIKQKCRNEVSSEFESREKLPRIKLKRNPLLRQAGQIYTPKVFEAFQDEYEWSTAAYIKPPLEGQLTNQYRVAISNPENHSDVDIEYQVFGDSATQIVSCSCKMFERLGILCAHALKVLDTMNIKVIPEKYILKRWTREARSGTIQDKSGRAILEDTKLDATQRYRNLCRKFIKVASRAANFEEVTLVLESRLDSAILEVDKKLSRLNDMSEPTSTLPNLNSVVEQSTIQKYDLNKITLKKKVRGKGGRRRKSWTEKFRKECRLHVTPNVENQQTQTKCRNKKRKQNHQHKENEEPNQHHVLVEQNVNLQQLGNREECNNNLEYCSNFSEANTFQSEDLNSQVLQDLISETVFGHPYNTNWFGL